MLQDIPPITVQIKFDDMSPEIENLLYFSTILLIMFLLYINLIMFDFIIKRIVFYKQKGQYYINVENEIN